MASANRRPRRGASKGKEPQLIRRHDPNARIVFVTVHAESMFVEARLAAGALGYILKDTAGDELVPAVRAALGGHQYVSRELDGFDRETEN